MENRMITLNPRQPKIPFGALQGFCVYIMAFNLLWPYFADSAFSALFSVVCFILFGMMWITTFTNRENTIKVNSFLCYAGLIVWSLMMIYGYGFLYSTHSKVSFLFFSMDAYSIFFIRLFVSVLPAMVYVDFTEMTMKKTVKAAILLVLVVTAALTAKAVTVNPDALRARAVMEMEGLEMLLRGTPAYAITYSYALLFPVFLHKYYSTKGTTRTYYLICLILLGYIVLVAQYATALLILLLGAVVYVLIVHDSRTRICVVLGVLFVAIVLSATNGGADIFRWIASVVEGSWVRKLEDIALSLSGQSDTGSISSRLQRYQSSFDAFVQSPILGKFWMKTGSIGGHATAIDVLGMSGMVGFLVMIACLYGNFARMKNHVSYPTVRPAVISCMVQFLVLIFTKNIVTSMAIFFTFFALIPLLLKSKETGENETVEETAISLRNTDNGDSIPKEE